MNKEQKCISLSLAQELQKVAKENDFELPESEGYWMRAGSKFSLFFKCNSGYRDESGIIIGKKILKSNEHYKAPDTSELGAILPHDFKSYRCVGQPPQWECSNDNLKWHCDSKKGTYREAMHDDTEAGVRCQMLIYLISNKLLDKI